MPPTRPSVVIVPAPGKAMPRFEAEQRYCRRLAYDRVTQSRGPEFASDAATSTAALSSATGAAAGALIGSLVGRVGVGALIGLGYGALFGASAAGNQAAASAAGLQYEFDGTYVQCMYSYGDHLVY